jgi:hypothetical protein
MNEDIKRMIEIYNTKDIDWMGDKITSLSDLTKHHIKKKQYDGEDTIDNYALLTTSSHHLIHYLEEKYYKDYLNINNLFIKLNQSKKKPDLDYYKDINIILKRIKKDIKNKRRNRDIKRR